MIANRSRSSFGWPAWRRSPWCWRLRSAGSESALVDRAGRQAIAAAAAGDSTPLLSRGAPSRRAVRVTRDPSARPCRDPIRRSRACSADPGVRRTMLLLYAIASACSSGSRSAAGCRRWRTAHPMVGLALVRLAFQFLLFGPCSPTGSVARALAVRRVQRRRVRGPAPEPRPAWTSAGRPGCALNMPPSSPTGAICPPARRHGRRSQGWSGAHDGYTNSASSVRARRWRSWGTCSCCPDRSRSPICSRLATCSS